MTKGVKVIKRDGVLENFDSAKISKVAVASGLKEKSALKLAKIVEDWALTQKTKKITSLRIRDKVIEEIQKVDKYAADLYIWFQKTLDRDNS